MLFHRSETYEMVPAKNGRSGSHIERVGRTPERIVEENHIARVDVVLAKKCHHLLQGVIVRAGKDGQAWCFREETAVTIIKTEPEVANFVHDGTVRGAHEVARHFTRGRKKIVANDF